MKKNRIRTVLEMIKFEHSVFRAAICIDRGAAGRGVPSRNGWPSLWQIVWIRGRHGSCTFRRHDGSTAL